MGKERKRLEFMSLSDMEMPSMDERRRRWNGWRLQGFCLAYHHPRRSGEYTIDVERFTTSAAVLDMVCQVAKKTWATGDCIHGLVRAINDIFNPQGSLCSFGIGKEMPLSDVKRRVAEWSESESGVI
jgi:hypothetical protein